MYKYGYPGLKGSVAPRYKGEKDPPQGAPDCLAGKTFVITGVLDYMEREEASDLILQHGGKVMGSVSGKVSIQIK